MDQREFEICLEYRICREFSGMLDKQLRHYWCDGITLDLSLRDGESPRIPGRAWICDDRQQDEWRVEFRLPHQQASRPLTEIGWEALLPAEDATRWLSLDFPQKIITIEPSVGIPVQAKSFGMTIHDADPDGN